MDINELTCDELREAAKIGIDLLKRKCGIKDDYGYLAVLDNATGTVRDVLGVGECPAQVADDWLVKMAVTRGKRLYRYPDHISSFQSRNEREGELGGAIRAPSAILSFACISSSEMEMEALATYIAYREDLITRAQALEIADISKNQFIAKIIR